jgi:hypothetical protein
MDAMAALTDSKAARNVHSGSPYGETVTNDRQLWVMNHGADWRADAASEVTVIVLTSGAAEQRADPAHALGGDLGVVAELLRHPAGAAARAELPHGDPDRLGHHVGGGRIVG